MKNILFALLLLPILYCLLPGAASALTTFPSKAQSKDETVTATIGSFYLTISGYQSPFASVVLTTKGGIFLRSTVADSKGYFTISEVLITDTFAGFCLNAVDFKRIGESEACIDIAGPITHDLEYKDIFLPPTIGLSKKQINAGGSAQIYGYTMPHATVKLSIDGKMVTLTADETGFYIYNYDNVPAGVYNFSASASLSGKDSLPPTKKVTLEAVSLPMQITSSITNAGQKALKNYPIAAILYGLIGLILLAAIAFLLYKLRFQLAVIVFDKLSGKKKMHHDWFIYY